MPKQPDSISRLKLLAFLPLVVIALFFVLFGIDSFYKLRALTTLEKDIGMIEHIASLSNELQRERRMSAGYLGSKGVLFGKELGLQRSKVDHCSATIALQSLEVEKLFRQHGKRLVRIRGEVDRLEIANRKTFDFYTKRIQALFGIYGKQIVAVKDHKAKNLLLGYVKLAMVKESLGQIRGAINGMLSSGKEEVDLRNRMLYAAGTRTLALYNLDAVAPQWMKEDLSKIISSDGYRWVEKEIRAFINHSNENACIEASSWWKASTEEINKFYLLESKFFLTLNKYISQKSKHIIRTFLADMVLFVLFSLLVFWLGWTVQRRILNNIKLLQEYKDAVDRSSIVSKTDKRGVITYANSKFCSISGYSQDELVGKSHNIVRHPDMPKKAFADLWKTILDKKPWYGIVKNRKKNGESYTVEVTISPIVNNEEEIEEFIAIRNDITSLIELHQNIENTQSDLITRLGEVIDIRDSETGSHVQRVAKYSELLAKYYGMDEISIRYLFLASPMHDIGKIGIPDYILNKSDKLTNEETEAIKEHALLGYNIFKDSNNPLLKAAATIAYEHHEKYDGTGYPRCLKGNKIHIYGRITALADVFDSLGSKRPYKEVWSDQAIFSLLKTERGKHFDPLLIDIFFEHLDEFLEIRKKFKDNTN